MKKLLLGLFSLLITTPLFAVMQPQIPGLDRAFSAKSSDETKQAFDVTVFILCADAMTVNSDGSLTVTYITTDALSNAAYGVAWDGDATHAPTKDAVYDKIETLGAGAGDVNSVGNCADGACNDGTSDGGSWLGLYSADGVVLLSNKKGQAWIAGYLSADNVRTERILFYSSDSANAGMLSSDGTVIYANKSIQVTGADGSNRLTLTNNTAIAPTAGTDEVYFDNNIFKVNENGTETSIVKSPTAGPITFAGPSAARIITVPDSANTIPTFNTMTDGKWCSYAAATGLACTENAPAGAGDVTGVGNCVDGQCNDGTSDGGSWISLYSAEGVVTLGNKQGRLYVQSALSSDNVTGNVTMKIPYGTGPSTLTAGLMTIDATVDQFKYYGSAERVIAYSSDKSWTVELPVTADDFVPFWYPPHDIKVNSMRCRVSGDASVTMWVGDGASTMDAITCGSSDAAVGRLEGPVQSTFTGDSRPLSYSINGFVPTQKPNWLLFTIWYTVVSK